MKPKSGSQRRMRCVIPTFVRWDRWCTKYPTVNRLKICIKLFSNFWPIFAFLSFFKRSFIDFHLPRDSVNERSWLSTSRSWPACKNTASIHAAVTKLKKKKENLTTSRNCKPPLPSSPHSSFLSRPRLKRLQLQIWITKVPSHFLQEKKLFIAIF